MEFSLTKQRTQGIYHCQSGYVALLSVIILSAAIIVLSFSVSQGSFFARFNGLDREYKQRSALLAESCVQAALLRLTEHGLVEPLGEFTVGQDKCSIVSLESNTPLPGQAKLRTQGIVQRAVTNFEVVIRLNPLTVISWQELANF